jgi:hypothetical protein
MSGGSFTPVLSVIEKYGPSWFLFGNPRSLFPSTTATSVFDKTSWTTRLLGYRYVPRLGALTTSLVSLSNESIAYRTANLNPDIYGLEFSYHEYLPVPNLFSAIFVHFLTKLLFLLLALPFIRWMLGKLSFEPGSGPDREQSRSVESAGYTAIGNSGDGKIRAKARFYYKGALVDISAILAVVAASVLLDRSKEGERRGEDLKGE